MQMKRLSLFSCMLERCRGRRAKVGINCKFTETFFGIQSYLTWLRRACSGSAQLLVQGEGARDGKRCGSACAGGLGTFPARVGAAPPAWCFPRGANTSTSWHSKAVSTTCWGTASARLRTLLGKVVVNVLPLQMNRSGSLSPAGLVLSWHPNRSPLPVDVLMTFWKTKCLRFPWICKLLHNRETEGLKCRFCYLMQYIR